MFLRRRGGLDLAKVKIASEALHQVKNCEVNSWILSGVDAVKKFSDTQVLGKKGTINWPFLRVQYIFSNLPICTLCNSSFLTEMKSFVAECWNHSFYSKLRHFQIRGDGDWRAHVRRVPMEKQFSTRLRNWRRTHKKRRLDLWLCQLMKFLKLSNTYKKLSAYRIFACQEGIVRVPSCKKTWDEAWKTHQRTISSVQKIQVYKTIV